MTSPMATLAGVEPPPLRLTGSHFAAAILFLIAGGYGLAWVAPELAAGAYLAPRVAGVVHLFTLGWITTSIMGALYPILPVALGREIAWMPLARVTLWVYAPGLAVFVAGLASYRPTVLVVGATAMGLGVLFFAANLAATLRRARPRDMTWWALAFACGFLVLTLVVGGALAANLKWAFMGGERLTALATHLHVGLVGWVLLVMVGVGQKLLPMFLLSHGAGERPGKAAVALLATGALSLFALHHTPGAWARWLPAGLIVLGVGAFLTQARLFYRTGKRPTLDPGLRLAAAGLGLLGVAMALGLVQLTRGFGSAVGATAYVAAAILGISLFVAGHYYKIVPFLVWYHRFAPLAGKTKVPTVAELYSAPMANVAATLLTIGAAGVVLAITLGSTAGIRAAAVLFTLGAAVEAAQLAHAARRKPL